MANKTISLPDDVLPIIDDLGMPFSRWVAEQLRRHAAQAGSTFRDQVLADAAMASPARRPTRKYALAVGQRMERTAPW